jgi:hypothetical protein
MHKLPEGSQRSLPFSEERQAEQLASVTNR